jgi:SAM-dependent methyltransferase
MAGGALDLLDEGSRADADIFAESYRSIRLREGWVDPTGRESRSGRPEVSGRSKSATRAATILAREWPDPAGRVVADIGSGTGWAHQLLAGFGVIAFDILPTIPSGSTLQVRADMRRLPLRDQTIDAAFFGAALHYVPVKDALSEAARILRPDGLLLVADSPIYTGDVRQAQAARRSCAYYGRAGYPELANHYHPIEIGALRSALAESGFALDRLSVEGRVKALWHRLARRPPATLLVGRRMRK